jgi:hypothetical protein
MKYSGRLKDQRQAESWAQMAEKRSGCEGISLLLRNNWWYVAARPALAETIYKKISLDIQ